MALKTSERREDSDIKQAKQAVRSSDLSSINREEAKGKQPEKLAPHAEHSADVVLPTHKEETQPEQPLQHLPVQPAHHEDGSTPSGISQEEKEPTPSVQKAIHTSLVQEDSGLQKSTSEARQTTQPAHQSAHSALVASLVQEAMNVTNGLEHLLSEHGVPPHKTKISLLIAGIVIFVMTAFGMSYCLIDRLFLKRNQRNSTTGSSADHVAKRKSHIHDGRRVYDWEQSASFVRLYIEVPKSVTKDDLNIAIGENHVQIGCKEKAPFMMGELHKAVNPEESHWRLRSNGELQIKLQKQQSGTWPRILKQG